jgi:hypothetical protein
MLNSANTIIEGLILIILGLFMYYWAVSLAPYITLSQVACNIPVVSKVLFQTCSEINSKSNIISYGPYFAIAVAVFGGILLIKGITMDKRKGEGIGDRYFRSYTR